MIKQRKHLSAAEVSDLHEWLAQRLDAVGLPSQPEVAMKLLDLSRKPSAQIADYVKILRTDQALAGRVMRLANSAYFAQRSPAASIDRACVVLGIDRLKAVSLGFHLSRAAQVPGDEAYSRQVWGESLFRACLCAELARLSAPGLISEAFILGLMMDAGLPVMPRLAGDAFRAIRDARPTPGRMYRMEFDELAYTHVDIITVLTKRWRFPAVIAQPLAWHHTRPADGARDDAPARLHRIAYVVGLVELSQVRADGCLQQPTMQTPGVATARRTLDIPDSDMANAVKKSFGEYGATIELFSDVAQGLTNVDALMDAVQVGLANAVDDVIERGLEEPRSAPPVCLILVGHSVELLKDEESRGVAYRSDSTGARLLSHRFELSSVNPTDVAHALGLDPLPQGDMWLLRDALTKLAA